jgi:hypothetical protein
MRRKRSWPETYAKDMLGTILELRGRVITEHEIVERRLRADMLFVPDPARRGPENLGVVDRMLDLGQCVIELFGRPPSAQAGFDCVSKHLAEHAKLRNQARRNRGLAPPRPRLWMITPGRPRSLIADMLMQPMEHWPTGFWQVGGKYNVHLIVVRDLPATPDTLLLRFLDHGERLERAFAELDALPQDWPLRQRLVQVALAWQTQISETFRTKLMMSPKTKALYDEWENKAIQKGIEKGKRALLRKQLMLRFGALPADAEERIEHASLAELELWAERVLSARSLAAVFAD